MLIAFDIGNTAATYGIYKKGRLKQFGSCLYSDIPKIVKNCKESGVNNNQSIIVSSVVPQITSKIKNLISSKKVSLMVAGENLPVPLKHRYPKNGSLGIDRIINVYGALQMYKAPALVIDFGTAVTFDYLSKKGVFEGGMIIPGPELSFQALIERAARLPKKTRLPHKTRSFLGTTTIDCLHSGILHGYGAMTDGLIERFKSKYGKGLKVVATGGFAKHLKPYTRQFEIVDPQHSVKSLYLVYKQHNI